MTGAALGAGRVVALYLATRGYGVAVHYATAQNAASQTVEQITAAGGHAVALQADLAEDTETEMLLTRAREALGGDIACLVNAASVEGPHGGVETPTFAEHDGRLAQPQRPALILMQAMAAQGLKPHRDALGEPTASGVIVTLIPQTGPMGAGAPMLQKLVERGLWEVTRTSAEALAPAIRVNAIGLGMAVQTGPVPAMDRTEGRTSAVAARQADLTASLGFFLDAHAVTGQLIGIDFEPAGTSRVADIGG